MRDPQTSEFSGELALYEEVVGLIREGNPDVILNLTTGLGSGFYPENPLLPCTAGPDPHIWPAEKRVEHVLKLKPEICTLDLVTGQVFGGIVISTEAVLTRMATMVREAGAKHLIAIGVLDSPGVNSFVIGLHFAMPTDTETMTYFRNLLPAGTQRRGFGIGRNQFPMATQSAMLGGHVRVGMEDNVFISKGQFAKSNAELVGKARRLVEELGPSIAAPSEALRILGLRPG